MVPASAATCDRVKFDGNRYTVCTIDMTASNVRLFLRNEDGVPYAQFAALPDGVQIAMNAGMYHDDRRPVGHYIEDGETEMRVITNAGPGNFGLLPNGVLCLNETTAQVIETLRYVREAPTCTHATQSGPMLVIDGDLHPQFLIDSTSRKRRNGVGTSADGQTLYWAITDNAVTFHEFGRLFRDHLSVPQALFLDGSISRLYDPANGRNDAGAAMGPIIAVVE
ncbi:phosphodiester glycosidase family protein [Shimia ponticola]|uniref:phosphodiester glycosidase family protein n=1 Tax=Shimia ponticola TaxID=2582893 RepID=UPI0011BF4C16|nr:phosphodiester glycosidase family protein [Shimia ponticola]